MEISKIKLTQIEPADYNPRTITEEAKKKLRNSIETFGLVEPIIINTKNNRIVSGHQRYDILLDMLMESDNLAEREFDYLVKDDYGYIFDFNQLQIKNEDYEKALNIVLNNTNLMGDYDYQKLGDLLNELEFNGFDLEFTGFDSFDIHEIEISGLDDYVRLGDDNIISQRMKEYDAQGNDDARGSLVRDFKVPPLSVFNTSQGYWQDRKKKWANRIRDNAQSREGLIRELGTSIFDATLGEIIIDWFTPNIDCAKIFDVFAGDMSMGYIASCKGHTFTGIEIRNEQVEINNEKISVFPNTESSYICDDGQNVLNHIKENSQDLFFSCPPYYDLEVYSDLPNDASNQATYEEFLSIIDNAFTNAGKCLKENRFAVIVCGDIRDKKGFYRGFPMDIIQIFRRNGFGLLNYGILFNTIGSASIRARGMFRNRKLAKVHQDVLVFYKGNLSKIQDIYQLPCEDYEDKQDRTGMKKKYLEKLEKENNENNL